MAHSLRRGHRPRITLAALAAAVVAANAGAVAPGVAASSVPSLRQPSTRPAPNHQVHLRSGHGIHVEKVARVGRRQLQVQIVPRDLRRSIGVRIILPVGYVADSEQHYPSLYLFPGTSGHSYDWATAGHAVKTTKPYGLITVDSDVGIDGDGGSWFTNWVNTKTKLGPSRWESYDIHELIPWIDMNLKTVRTRSERAIAGLSMGGYGAMELAARHPDLFTMAASFSGAPEIDRGADVRVGATAIIAGTMVGLNGVEPDAPFGSHLTNEINWQGHDPARLIQNLRGLKLWLATGDGRPGPYDDPVTDPTGAVYGGIIESLAKVSTDSFHHRLIRQNIPSSFHYYGAGTHNFPYWARDFHAFITPLMKRFAHPVGRRKHVHYTSIQPRWHVFGWHAKFRRAHRLEFSNLSRATRHSFRLSGTGHAVIRTPRFYRPHTTYQVDLPRQHPLAIRTNGKGQLRIPLRLGQTEHLVHVGIRSLEGRAPLL